MHSNETPFHCLAYCCLIPLLPPGTGTDRLPHVRWHRYAASYMKVAQHTMHFALSTQYVYSSMGFFTPTTRFGWMQRDICTYAIIPHRGSRRPASHNRLSA